MGYVVLKARSLESAEILTQFTSAVDHRKFYDEVYGIQPKMTGGSVWTIQRCSRVKKGEMSTKEKKGVE